MNIDRDDSRLYEAHTDRLSSELSKLSSDELKVVLGNLTEEKQLEITNIISNNTSKTVAVEPYQITPGQQEVIQAQFLGGLIAAADWVELAIFINTLESNYLGQSGNYTIKALAEKILNYTAPSHTTIPEAFNHLSWRGMEAAMNNKSNWSESAISWLSDALFLLPSLNVPDSELLNDKDKLHYRLTIFEAACKPMFNDPKLKNASEALYNVALAIRLHTNTNEKSFEAGLRPPYL